MKPQPSDDVTRVLLLVLLIGLLLVGSFWTLLPFLGALVWAATIVVATWPLLLLVQRKTGGRRPVAVFIMTALILLVFIVPLAVAINALLSAGGSPALLQDFIVRGLGEPPAWIARVPLVGNQVTARWQELAAGGPQAIADFARPYARSAAAWVISITGGIGRLIVQFVLILALTAILYAQGETAARGALAFGRRIGGERGEGVIRLAGQAIRSIALGVIVTALVQSVLAGAGLWVSSVPHAGLLTAIMFALGIAQLGPLPVLIPTIAWLYWSGNAAFATGLLIWGLPVAALDNVVRPILIRRGVQLPMLLIIGGVIGGLISFGVLGLFIGPVFLAATYTLAREWVAMAPDESADAAVVVPPR